VSIQQSNICDNTLCTNLTPPGRDKCNACRATEPLNPRPNTNPVNPRPTAQKRQEARNYKCGDCGTEFNSTDDGACPLCGFDGGEKEPEQQDVEEYLKDLSADEVARIILDNRGEQE